MAKAIVSGVYKIQNVTNGKCYVGSGQNMPRRWKNHRSLLNRGIHHSIKLQRAWEKYGEQSFLFGVLEVVESYDSLIEVEQKWIDALSAADKDKGYNVAESAYCTRGFAQSDESRKKRSESLKGRKRPPEIGKKISATKKGNTHHSEETRRKIGEAGKGRVQSEETRRKRSLSCTGRKMSKEAIEKSVAKRKGKSPSAETRAKMSAAKAGKKQDPEVVARRAISIREAWARRKEAAKQQATT